ncbi:MAG: AEC family transporter [Alphaproteobacteria bacterium]|nr:AEC family transporter [Alphaproteobacteria bacterium]
MEIFFLLFTNMIPIYLLIALGWVAGRFYGVDRQSLGALCIYILMPLMVFSFVVKLELDVTFIILPFIVYIILSAMSFMWLYIGYYIYHDKRANLLAMTASAGNFGYIGVPIVIILFEPQWVAVYIFMLLGGIFYEATTMYYVAARSSFNIKESMLKLAKFPSLYAVALALLFNIFDITLPAFFDPYWEYSKGAYVVVGIMIIGVALSPVKRLVVAPRFLFLTFVAQFIMWPFLAWGLIMLDQLVLKVFDPEVHKLFFIMSIVPPAANIAAFSVQLDLKPEKAATTILIGTVFALFYIPAMLVLSGMY